MTNGSGHPDPASLARAGRILGLDIGDRRIGLAVSIPPGELILPAGHLPRRGRRADVAAILEEARRRAAVAIVAGMPYDGQGRAGVQARKTAALARALARAASVPMLTVDESFTTQAALAELQEAGDYTRGAGHPAPGAVDAAAAAAILRRFLEAAPAGG